MINYKKYYLLTNRIQNLYKINIIFLISYSNLRISLKYQKRYFKI